MRGERDITDDGVGDGVRGDWCLAVTVFTGLRQRTDEQFRTSAGREWRRRPSLVLSSANSPPPEVCGLAWPGEAGFKH